MFGLNISGGDNTACQMISFRLGALCNVWNVGFQISSIITNSAFITNSYVFRFQPALKTKQCLKLYWSQRLKRYRPLLWFSSTLLIPTWQGSLHWVKKIMFEMVLRGTFETLDAAALIIMDSHADRVAQPLLIFNVWNGTRGNAWSVCSQFFNLTQDDWFPRRLGRASKLICNV